MIPCDEQGLLFFLGGRGTILTHTFFFVEKNY